MRVRRALTEKQYQEQINQILSNLRAKVPPNQDNDEKAKRERRERGRKDPEWFKRYYLPHYFSKPSGDVHRELHELWQIGGKSLFAFLMPRDHGKTTHGSFGDTIYDAVYETSPYTVLIWKTAEIGKQFLGTIKVEFEQNERLRQDFGDLVTRGEWKDDYIVVGDRTCIQTLGARQKIRGLKFRHYRVTKVKLEDIDDDISVKNVKLCRETLKWILGAVFPSIDDDGVCGMIGTMIARSAVIAMLVQHIKENQAEFKRKHGVQRMFYRIHAAIKPDGTPLWPEGKSLEKLLEIKDMVGPLVWAAEYMNDPIDDSIFNPDWDTFYQREPVILLPHEWEYLSGTDPSAKSSELHNDKAHVVLGRKVTDRSYLYVVEAWIRKASIPDMIEAYLDYYREYGMVASEFETNGYQAYIKEVLEEELFSKGLFPNIIEINHTLDKIVRISRLVNPVRKSRIQFIRGHSDQDLLREQLHHLGSSMNDDGPDALEMAVHVSEHWGGEIVMPARSSRKRSFAPGSRVMAGRQRIGAYRTEYLGSH